MGIPHGNNDHGRLCQRVQAVAVTAYKHLLAVTTCA